MKRLVITNSPSSDLSYRLSRALECELHFCDVQRFPDYEPFVQFEQELLTFDQPILLYSLNPIAADEIWFFIPLTLNVFSVNHTRTSLILPYLPFSRQDKVVSGLSSALVVFAQQVLSLSIQKVITIEVHSKFSDSVFNQSLVSLSMVNELSNYLQLFLRSLSRPILVSLDRGRREWVSEIAQNLGVEFAFFDKIRVSSNQVSMSCSANFKHRDVVLIDDIISTGGTMIGAIRHAREAKADSIHSLAVHGVFSGGADKVIAPLVDSLVVTNTIETEYSQIDVTPLLLGEVLRND